MNLCGLVVLAVTLHRRAIVGDLLSFLLGMSVLFSSRVYGVFLWIKRNSLPILAGHTVTLEVFVSFRAGKVLVFLIFMLR